MRVDACTFRLPCFSHSHASDPECHSERPTANDCRCSVCKRLAQHSAYNSRMIQAFRRSHIDRCRISSKVCKIPTAYLRLWQQSGCERVPLTFMQMKHPKTYSPLTAQRPNFEGSLKSADPGCQRITLPDKRR